MTYSADEKGYYGEFGGAFIPELLYANVEELRLCYKDIIAEESFQKENPGKESAFLRQERVWAL